MNVGLNEIYPLLLRELPSIIVHNGSWRSFLRGVRKNVVPLFKKEDPANCKPVSFTSIPERVINLTGKNSQAYEWQENYLP